jgi:hypothetical protein
MSVRPLPRQRTHDIPHCIRVDPRLNRAGHDNWAAVAVPHASVPSTTCSIAPRYLCVKAREQHTQPRRLRRVHVPARRQSPRQANLRLSAYANPPPPFYVRPLCRRSAWTVYPPLAVTSLADVRHVDLGWATRYQHTRRRRIVTSFAAARSGLDVLAPVDIPRGIRRSRRCSTHAFGYA